MYLVLSVTSQAIDVVIYAHLINGGRTIYHINIAVISKFYDRLFISRIEPARFHPSCSGALPYPCICA